MDLSITFNLTVWITIGLPKVIRIRLIFAQNISTIISIIWIYGWQVRLCNQLNILYKNKMMKTIEFQYYFLGLKHVYLFRIREFILWQKMCPRFFNVFPFKFKAYAFIPFADNVNSRYIVGVKFKYGMSLFRLCTLGWLIFSKY